MIENSINKEQVSDSEIKTDILQNAIEGKVVVDSRGRTFLLKKPSVIDRYRFIKAMGDDSNRPALLGMAQHIMYIKKIDSDVFLQPSNNAECMAALNLVGEEGWDVVSDAINKYMDQMYSEKEAIAEIKK